MREETLYELETPYRRSSKSEDFAFKTIAESIPETSVLLYNDSGRLGQAGLCKKP